MIFFTENIEPFFTNGGMRCLPHECQLKTGESGYFLGDDWAVQIIPLVSSLKYIEKDDIQLESEIVD